MKITHICLLSPVTDGWTYQDNLLTKYHQKNGNDVTIITSQWHRDSTASLVRDVRKEYINPDGVKVIRLKIKGSNNYNNKFKKHKNFLKEVIKSTPDILFVHGCQFLDIKNLVKFAKKNKNVKIYVDNHADFSNSARNWLSKNLLHKFVWKKYANLIEPYTEKFYGVLPSRVDFLIEQYKLPTNKVDLLVLGADDEKVKEVKENNIKAKIRKLYGIKDDDFLIVTGGKIDLSKRQILTLMKAVKKIDNKKIKLIIFGSIIEEMKEELRLLSNDDRINYIGWIKSEKTYSYFEAADLIVFPGRHSVLWEQAVGQGKPLIVKYWEGTTHVDLGGNVKFLYHDSIEETINCIEDVYHNKKELQKMKVLAEKKGMEKFSYQKIAKLSIK